MPDEIVRLAQTKGASKHQIANMPGYTTPAKPQASGSGSGSGDVQVAMNAGQLETSAKQKYQRLKEEDRDSQRKMAELGRQGIQVRDFAVEAMKRKEAEERRKRQEELKANKVEVRDFAYPM